MCIGIAIVTMPPIVSALGYMSWFQGQSIYCYYNLMNLSAPPEIYSWTSNASGIATVAGVYYLQSSTIFPLLESSGAKDELQKHALRPHHLTKKITTQAQTGYVPPESMTELAVKVGPPLMLRIAATSIAFFAAGMIQTHVEATLMNPPDPRRRS
jgi:hypothetical protein